jgi:hypothetical protein
LNFAARSKGDGFAQHGADWPGWYADFIVNEQAGKPPQK